MSQLLKRMSQLLKRMSHLLNRMNHLLKRISRRAAWTVQRGATERQRAAGLRKERTVRKKRPDEDFPKGFLRKRILRFVILKDEVLPAFARARVRVCALNYLTERLRVSL
jgi:hypothetical protein